MTCQGWSQRDRLSLRHVGRLYCSVQMDWLCFANLPRHLEAVWIIRTFQEEKTPPNIAFLFQMSCRWLSHTASNGVRNEGSWWGVHHPESRAGGAAPADSALSCEALLFRKVGFSKDSCGWVTLSDKLQWKCPSVGGKARLIDEVGRVLPL